jgi:hypothetical protein
MSKRTNLGTKDAASLHIAHIVQRPTSRPTTKAMHITMVNAPKKNFLPLPVVKYGKSTKWSSQQCHQAHEGKSGLNADTVGALGGLCSL